MAFVVSTYAQLHISEKSFNSQSSDMSLAFFIGFRNSLCDLPCRFNFSPSGVSKVEREMNGGGGVDSNNEEGDGRPDFESVAGGLGTLDKELSASGFTRKNQEVLEKVRFFSCFVLH